MDVLQSPGGRFRARSVFTPQQGLVLLLLACLVCAGCYAPLVSPGIPARSLPDEYRFPSRSAGIPINYATLTLQPPADYIIGSGDVLDVTVPDLFPNAVIQPVRVPVMSSGEIQLPLVGPVHVAGLNLLQAQRKVEEAYADGFLKNPRVNVVLFEKASVSVLVLGAVNEPGVYPLPKYENDIGHALAAAGGFNDDAGVVVEVHRRSRSVPPIGVPGGAKGPAEAPGGPKGPADLGDPKKKVIPASHVQFAEVESVFRPVLARRTTGEAELSTKVLGASAEIDLPLEVLPAPAPAPGLASIPHAAGPPCGPPCCGPPCGPPRGGPRFRGGRVPPRYNYEGVVPSQGGPMTFPTGPEEQVLTIPLRGTPGYLDVNDIALGSGDVVVVPNRRNEVFFVVGPLAESNFVRFTVRERERELGAGFILPKDRDIDVVTAVAMAGYIDPIDSPTTVTVHRTLPDGRPMLIRVNLIKARHDRRETVMVAPGDIIYLNPDPCWWFRRTFDRVVADLIIIPYDQWMRVRLILPRIPR